jgi:hypothetical protein
MDMSAILRAVPGADPAFVDLMLKAPEPPAHDRERLLHALPELHRLFLEKKLLLPFGDDEKWQSLLREEKRLIANYEAV